MQQLWGHVFPSFDAWWPNIIASMVWVPLAAACSYFVHRRRHDRLVQMIGKLHQRIEEKQ